MARKSKPAKNARPSPQRIAVKFTEAIEFLRRRLAIGAEEWMEILAEEGVTSTMVADDTLRSVTEDLAQAVLDAIEGGGTLETFREDYGRIVAEHGWSYEGNAGWHSQLIFRLHTGTAFAAGRWEQAQQLEAARPGTILVRYITAGDHRVRHTHAEMHGVVLPIGHPWWRTHWPPNGFNCRCHIQIVTQQDLLRYGWSVTTDSDPRLSVPPDPGWGFNPGIAGGRVRQLQRAREGA